MPMESYLYHGQALGFEADIWEPGPHKVDGHACCGLPDKKPGVYTGTQGPFEISGLISHGGCTTKVHAMEENKDNYFRTEVHATLKDLNVEKGALTADEVTLGMVSVYRRHWFDNGKWHARRVRVIPYGCKIVNLRLNGVPVPNFLPAPFQYSVDRCETYLHADEPDKEVDAELRDAVVTSPSRFLYVKNFGRIYFGEWTLLPSENWHPIHQITMVRMALGSPQTGSSGGPGGQNDGTPG
ncbi:MAG TPA: hypothetical protein VMI94_27645 [Bryobacteraceae bacterium]|nr:hypothetical protein [Bryobacteraceae bacterium]